MHINAIAQIDSLLALHTNPITINLFPHATADCLSPNLHNTIYNDELGLLNISSFESCDTHNV